MRDRLNSMSAWVLLVVSWVFWAAIAFAMSVVYSSELVWSAVFAVAVGLLVGGAITFGIKARFRWENRALGDAPKDVRRLALKAAWKGPIPADPEIRTAAINVAQEQLRQMRRTRPILIIALSLGLIAAVGSAVTGSGSPWRLLYNLPYLGLLGTAFFFTPRRLRKRLALLSGAE